MNCYSVPFAKIDQDEDFRQLALSRGKIKRWHLDAGLHLRVSDLVFSAPVELRKEAVPLYITQAGFQLICILTPGTVHLKSINEHQQVTKLPNKTLVMAPDNVNMVLQAAKDEPVQILDFQIAPYWLRHQPHYVQLAKYFEEVAVNASELPVLIETSTRKMDQHATKLFDHALGGHCISGLFNSAEQLIVEFLESLQKMECDKANGNIPIYYEKIMEAEELLQTYLHSTLPRLHDLAQQVALSESTLKRYFKMVFGKSIYEYYLNKKMEKAHKLLLEKPLTVNEAAELMGYEKVSNFIDIFKKHHGYSPGTMRKKNSEGVSGRIEGIGFKSPARQPEPVEIR